MNLNHFSSKYAFAFNQLYPWSSVDAFVSGAGGLKFKSRIGQIGHSVADSLPPLRHFFKRTCADRAQSRGESQLVTRFDVLQRG